MIRGKDAAERRAADRRREALTFVAGLALIGLLVATVLSITAAFDGDFSTYVDVRADLPAGQPVEPRAEVQFRQVQVGQVGKIRHTLAGGGIEVTLQIDPSQLAHIPADVSAVVVPTSLFGTETVVLESAGTTTAHLTSKSLIPATGGSASLQGTLTDLNNLLTGLHPAEIDTTLSALSTAFEGQGQAASDAVRAFNSYLSGLVPQLPTLDGDIDLLTPVLDGLSASVPALLDVAENSGSVAQTISQDQTLIATLMSDGADLAATGRSLLDDVGTSLHTFVTDLAPLLSDFDEEPNLPATILNDLDRLTTAFLPALDSSSSPTVSVTVAEGISSPYEAFIAGDNLPVLSARQDQQEAHAAFAIDMNPPFYTASNCPHYASEAGPNCAGASPSGSSTTSSSSTDQTSASSAGGSTDVATLSASQQDAVAERMSGIESHAPSQPATDDLILAPLLQSLAS